MRGPDNQGSTVQVVDNLYRIYAIHFAELWMYLQCGIVPLKHGNVFHYFSY